MGQARRIESDVENVLRDMGSATAEMIRDRIVDIRVRGTHYGIRNHDVGYCLRRLKTREKVVGDDSKPTVWHWIGD